MSGLRKCVKSGDTSRRPFDAVTLAAGVVNVAGNVYLTPEDGPVMARCVKAMERRLFREKFVRTYNRCVAEELSHVSMLRTFEVECRRLGIPRGMAQHVAHSTYAIARKEARVLGIDVNQSLETSPEKWISTEGFEDEETLDDAIRVFQTLRLDMKERRRCYVGQLEENDRISIRVNHDPFEFTFQAVPGGGLKLIDFNFASLEAREQAAWNRLDFFGKMQTYTFGHWVLKTRVGNAVWNYLDPPDFKYSGNMSKYDQRVCFTKDERGLLRPKLTPKYDPVHIPDPALYRRSK